MLICVLAASLFVSNKVTHAASYCQVTYQVTNQWPGGFGGSITIQNTGSSAWTSWSLTFTFPNSSQKVTQGWNGSFSQSGQNVTVTNMSWNGSVGVNGSINPGFNGAWSGSNPVPTNFSVNGVACNGATGVTPTTVATQPPTPGITPTFGPTPTPITGTGTAGMVISHGSYNVPEVALTFDDGPSQYTPQVLAMLQRYNVHATFFPIGQNIASYPGYLQQDIAAGNVVGNHSWTHPHMTGMSQSAMYTELSNTQTAVQNATGIRPTLFRPPFGEYNADLQSVVKELGLTLITWNVQANDWDSPPPSPDAIASRVLNSVGNGSIILLHEGGGDRSNTVAALPAIITGIQARGLRLVTIPQLIADMNR